MKKKALLISLIALAMALCVFAGATIAYLFVNTDPVVNTFSPSNISLDLDESENLDLQMIPGMYIKKDPKVTASADVDFYVFVKVTELNNFDNFMTYAIASGWKLYDSGSETIDTVANDEYVLYRELTAGKHEISILEGDKVYVPDTVLKDAMKPLYNANGTVNTDACPKLTFKAAAVQQDTLSVQQAYAQISTALNS